MNLEPYTVTLTVIDWNGDYSQQIHQVHVYGADELVVNIGGQSNVAQGDQ